jgi:3-amino-5-hydroxybenzoic acid synthesis related protein
MNKGRNIKAVLFDLDGVLINSLAVMKMALQASIQSIYPKMDNDFEKIFESYCLHLGKGFPEIMQNLNLSEKLHEPFKRHSRYLTPYVYLYPDIKKLLDYLKDNQFVLAIATGKDYDRSNEILNSLGIGHYFSQVYASDRFKNAKPAPDMALQFFQDYSLKRTEVLFVGDAPADINCGKSAGCGSAAALWGYGQKTKLQECEPDYWFDSPLMLLQQLQQWEKGPGRINE